MKCPECGKECPKGVVEAQDMGILTQLTTQLTTLLSWCPDDQKGKFIKKGVVNLKLYGEGYYCDECMKVFAVFQEK